jgi:two-component system phosphate regulon sensor histidine kinase PhoR
LEDEQNRAKFVETIRNQASRLEAIVEDLLELADLDRPDAALNLKDGDLAEVVRDMAAGFEETAARRGLKLTLEVRPGLRASFDRKRVEVALRNLLDNAIKYTDSGTVRVSGEAGSGRVRISVADTGRGISAEHLPRVFERFYRVDRGRARATGGTGLGLSIVKHAIELHGGTVGVESAPQQGSTFWFEIPVNGGHGGAPKAPIPSP